MRQFPSLPPNLSVGPVRELEPREGFTFTFALSFSPNEFRLPPAAILGPCFEKQTPEEFLHFLREIDLF